MKTFQDATAIILSGGKSSRMGTDKGLVFFNGRHLITYAINLLQPLFGSVIIVANNDAYTKFGLPVHTDDYFEKGPLAGIFSGLSRSSASHNFVIACDMPFVTEEIIIELMYHNSDCDSVIPYHENKPEPLCAVYNTSCLPVVEQQIMKGQYKVQDLFSLLKVCKIEISSDKFNSGNPFRNINTPEDLVNSER